MIINDEDIRSTIDAYATLLVSKSTPDDDIYHAYQQAIKNGVVGAQEAYDQIATASARERYGISFLPAPRNAADIIQLNQKNINYIGAHQWLELLINTTIDEREIND